MKTLGEPVAMVEPQSTASPILQAGFPFTKTLDEPDVAVPA